MSFLTQDQIISMSTAQILNHYGAGVEITVTRSERTNTPIIIFRSLNAGVCTALATKHCAVLAKMQADWHPWKGNAAKERNTQTYFSTIALKGLRPSTLRRWVDAARAQGFVVDDQVSVVPTVKGEVVSKVDTALAPLEALAAEYGEVEVVGSIPVEARPVVTHKPFGLPGKQATVKELRQVLRAQGKSTKGNKTALLARL